MIRALVQFNSISQKNANAAYLAVSISCGLFVYFALSYLLVATGITIGLSIAMSMLIFGLTSYYSTTIPSNNHKPSADSMVKKSNVTDKKNASDEYNNNLMSVFIFVGVYGVLIVICTLGSNPDLQIFTNWNQIGAVSIIQLAASILLCFFLPGYALVHIVFKKYNLGLVLTVLLSYFISMLLIGGTEYISALYFDKPVSETRNIIITILVVVLVVFITVYVTSIMKNIIKITIHFPSNMKYKVISTVSTKGSELVVFAGLLMLLLTSTYYLFGGITIGDQWFHQGRALLFMSGSIKEAALTSVDPLYTPFQSAILAANTALSGIPLVNTYASIAFLNMTQIFGFYYFVSKWIPQNMQRAKILASTLFAIGSGFGWIYLFNLIATSDLLISQNSILDIITSTEPFDVFQPTNFFLASHPDFSTGLIYIVIPAGFVLLGVIRSNLKGISIFIIVTLISILGILSHDEFYLFMMIVPILPLLFKINQANFVYCGLLISFFIIFLLDSAAPQNYYTTTANLNYYTSSEAFTIPLPALSALFTGLTWLLHLILQKLYRTPTFLDFKKYILKQWNRNTIHAKRFQFIVTVILISFIGYTYALSFIVLGHLSIDDIKMHSAGIPYNIPWYLYPMKFGIIGLIGLAWVLSYFFKKFKKEIFIFGIMIIIALFAGPYYDEHRLSKYIMAGMAGFAALLLYTILNYLTLHDKHIIKFSVIGLVITVASLSSILYVGYNSLILQTQNFEQSLLSRRNFPSESDMNLFQAMYDKMDLNSPKYNILTFPKEYNRDRGLMTFFQAFSGYPERKVFEKPLTLNVSTLDSFYQLLDNSGVRHIVLTKESIAEKSELSAPLRFAMDHFGRAYEDDRFLVLDVPDLAPPSDMPQTDIALIYDRDRRYGTSLSNVSSIKFLEYNDNTFNFAGETSIVTIQKDNKTDKMVISAYDNSNGISLWSKPFDDNSLNYFEIGFQILVENQKSKNDVGVKWKAGDTEYFVALSDDGLGLLKKLKNEDGYKMLYQNNEIEKRPKTIYTLKLEVDDNLLNIYFDNIQRIQMPWNHTWNQIHYFSQVGISASNSNVLFEAPKIGKILQDNMTYNTRYNEFYYPLSFLALSKNKYDVFSDKDLSVLSKKEVILPFDPIDWDDDTFNSFMNYGYKGGSIVVLNSNNFNGRFGELFSIRTSDDAIEKFVRINGDNNQSVTVSGVVNKVNLNSSSDTNVTSWYKDNSNRNIAPFTIEKKFESGGRILLVNSKPFFQSLSNSPNQYFMSLSYIPALLDLYHDKNESKSGIPPLGNQFIRDIAIHGNVTLNGSSLLLEDNSAGKTIQSDRMLIASGQDNQIRDYDNLTIKDLKLEGHYQATINSNGTLRFPKMASQGEYVSIDALSSFNMKIDILPHILSSAKIIILNGSNVDIIETSDNSTILFSNITAKSKPITLLMKNPELNVIGNMSFMDSNFDWLVSNIDIPFEASGKWESKIGLVDDYYRKYDNGTTKINFVTFLDSEFLGESVGNEDLVLNLPGDISPDAKVQGPHIPLKQLLLSHSNVILLISTCITSIIVSWLLWPKIKSRVQ